MSVARRRLPVVTPAPVMPERGETLQPAEVTAEQVEPLVGSVGLSWNVTEQVMLRSATAYFIFGCPDWGMLGGVRQPGLCTFCGLPGAVQAYLDAFFDGHLPSNEVLLGLFLRTLSNLPSDIQILKIFNGGSFLFMPPELQEAVAHAIAAMPTVREVVVESRAAYVTTEAVRRLTSILRPAGKRLQVLIGIETQDDHLRLKVLRKGHSRTELYRAAKVMKDEGVIAASYVLLNPAPKLPVDWARKEARQTIAWILGSGLNDLGFAEVQFAPTCIAPDTALFEWWEKGEYTPSSLTGVHEVLLESAQRFPGHVVLGQFKDQPPFIAVPSNHRRKGIHEDLNDAEGCDRAFHAMLENYRATMDPTVLLELPSCDCRPDW